MCSGPVFLHLGGGFALQGTCGNVWSWKPNSVIYIRKDTRHDQEGFIPGMQGKTSENQLM